MSATASIRIRKCQLRKVPRKQNTKADILSKLSAGKPLEGTWIESLSRKSINKDVSMADMVNDWTTSIREFVLHEKLLDNQIQARKVRTTSARYILIDDQLYKTMGNWPLPKCINKEDGKIYYGRYMKAFVTLILQGLWSQKCYITDITGQP